MLHSVGIERLHYTEVSEYLTLSFFFMICDPIETSPMLQPQYRQFHYTEVSGYTLSFFFMICGPIDTSPMLHSVRYREVSLYRGHWVVPSWSMPLLRPAPCYSVSIDRFHYTKVIGWSAFSFTFMVCGLIETSKILHSVSTDRFHYTEVSNSTLSFSFMICGPIDNSPMLQRTTQSLKKEKMYFLAYRSCWVMGVGRLTIG